MPAVAKTAVECVTGKCIRRFRFRERPLPGQIVFRADRVDGEEAPQAPQGKSEVRVPGIFTIHGPIMNSLSPPKSRWRGVWDGNPPRQPSTSRSLTQPG